jgi:AcrR family transcriptional regulator
MRSDRQAPTSGAAPGGSGDQPVPAVAGDARSPRASARGPSARDRIVDALRDQIAQGGVASATLDAVAARAGMSKGGLLYHFPSKSALFDALTERLRADTAANLARVESLGAVRAFLQTSCPSADEAGNYWAAFAAVHSGSTEVSPSARATVAEVFEVWSSHLRAAVADPVLADIIRLVGDGLYLSAVTGLPLPDGTRIQHVIDHLMQAARNGAR